MKKCRGFLLLAVLTGLGIAGLAPPTRADFEVQFSYNGAVITLDQTTGTTTVSGGASLTGATIDYSAPGVISVLNLTVSNTGTTGGFRVTATIADSNKPGSPTVATIDNSSLQIRNQTGVAGNSSLTLTTGDTGFTSPTGSKGLLSSTISVTASGLNVGTTNGVVMNSYVDTTNAQFGKQQGSPTITLGPVAAGASASGNTASIVTAISGSYSLTQVEVFTLANGDRFTDGSSGTTLTTPAPASFALLLTALPVLYLGARARRARIALA